ncbi:hypothetical protein K474DRAFT_1659512 [Panus rudis PR-1116 ss-1]|nr:hypothetical protein K474DRAFT_1659512 [Panus rudis PR-1116 ss-1]
MRFSIILAFAVTSISWGCGAYARPIYQTSPDAVASEHMHAELDSRDYEYFPLIAREVLGEWPASNREVQERAYDDDIHRLLKRYFGAVQRQPRLTINENGEIALPKQKQPTGLAKLTNKIGGWFDRVG